MDTLTIPAGSKRLEMGVITEGAFPRRVHGDPVRLRQVLMNLAGNAVKFTDSGEVTIGVRVLSDGPQGLTLRFDIADTGIGIHEKDRERLFRKFSQVDYRRTRRNQGTGLGLAISKDLVRLMGGKIGVDSEPGRGSTFWFTTELQYADDADMVDSGLDGMQVTGFVPGETLRHVITSLLRGLGVEASLFSDPAELACALRDAAGSDAHYHFILADHSHLPDTVEKSILASGTGPCSTAFCKVSLDWADGLPHGNEGRWDRVLTRPVTWRKLRGLLEQSKEVAETGAVTKPVEAAGLSGHILLVEDSPTLQLVTRTRLEKLGCRVEVASNGREAVEAVENNDFGIVLMDIQMPEMDGITSTRIIRDMPASGKACVPIIALTANAMKGDAEEYLAAGMNGYLTKPIDNADLTRILRRWLT